MPPPLTHFSTHARLNQCSPYQILNTQAIIQHTKTGCVPSYQILNRKAIIQHTKAGCVASYSIQRPDACNRTTSEANIGHNLSHTTPICSHDRPYGCHHTASKADVSSHIEPYEAIICHIYTNIQHPKAIFGTFSAYLKTTYTTIQSRFPSYWEIPVLPRKTIIFFFVIPTYKYI